MARSPWSMGVLLLGSLWCAPIAAQPQEFTIVDGPGAGQVIIADNGNVTGPGATGGTIQEHGGNCPDAPFYLNGQIYVTDAHFHGTLNGAGDPAPAACGHGRVLPGDLRAFLGTFVIQPQSVSDQTARTYFSGTAATTEPDLSFWAGQRFYRRSDVHVSDFFFFDMTVSPVIELSTITTAPDPNKYVPTGYRLPLPAEVTLPGVSDGLRPEAVQFLQALTSRGLAFPIVDRFWLSGGTFTVETLTEPGDLGRYSEAKVLKVPATWFVNGVIDPNMRSADLATLVHEFWHAYMHQVVLAGFDPVTSEILDRAKTWLAGTRVRPVSGGGVDPAVPTTPFASAGITNSMDFLDEYIGALLNEMVPKHISLRNQIRNGDTTLEDAKGSWRSFIDKMTTTSRYSAYQDADAGEYQVDAAPPRFLVDHLANLNGLGNF